MAEYSATAQISLPGEGDPSKNPKHDVTLTVNGAVRAQSLKIRQYPISDSDEVHMSWELKSQDYYCVDKGFVGEVRTIAIELLRSAAPIIHRFATSMILDQQSAASFVRAYCTMPAVELAAGTTIVLGVFRGNVTTSQLEDLNEAFRSLGTATKKPPKTDEEPSEEMWLDLRLPPVSDSTNGERNDRPETPGNRGFSARGSRGRGHRRGRNRGRGSDRHFRQQSNANPQMPSDEAFFHSGDHNQERARWSEFAHQQTNERRERRVSWADLPQRDSQTTTHVTGQDYTKATAQDSNQNIFQNVTERTTQNSTQGDARCPEINPNRALPHSRKSADSLRQPEGTETGLRKPGQPAKSFHAASSRGEGHPKKASQQDSATGRKNWRGFVDEQQARMSERQLSETRQSTDSDKQCSDGHAADRKTDEEDAVAQAEVDSYDLWTSPKPVKEKKRGGAFFYTT